MTTAESTGVANRIGISGRSLLKIRNAFTHACLKHGVKHHSDILTVAEAAVVTMTKDTIAGVKAAKTMKRRAAAV